jgi:hypothetical protein
VDGMLAMCKGDCGGERGLAQKGGHPQRWSENGEYKGVGREAVARVAYSARLVSLSTHFNHGTHVGCQRALPWFCVCSYICSIHLS